MDVREKLIELISDFVIHVPHEEGQTWEEACTDHLLTNGVTVQEWISVKDKLPENSKKEGAFCPRYFVMTKYGESFGWYNPNFKSWFVLFWFFTDRLLAEEIDFERADVPKIVKVPDGVVTHWMEMPKPPKRESGGKA